jgi:hypothetical protein
MGLAEHLRDGAVLERRTIPFSGDGIISTSFGAAYVILGIEVDEPCRIRFYDDQTSANNALEQTRSFGDITITTDIGLIADISMSEAGVYTIDPVLFGVPENTSSYLTYINITENSAPPVNGNLFVYVLEDADLQPDEDNPFYDIPLRRTLTFNGNRNTLTSADDLAPKTYLMIDAVSDTNCRLRLYGKSQSLLNQTEMSRSFHEAIMDPSLVLLADMLLDSGSITKFIPKLIGKNIETTPLDLSSIAINRSAIEGFSEIYYKLEPNGSVEMNILALED